MSRAWHLKQEIHQFAMLDHDAPEIGVMADLMNRLAEVCCDLEKELTQVKQTADVALRDLRAKGG